DEQSVEATRDQIVRRDREDSTVSQFITAADGVVTVDTSTLDLAGAVQAVLAVVHEHAPA
ncbi:MAG: cytidylate kinase, partial [Terracoccus sp.]